MAKASPSTTPAWRRDEDRPPLWRVWAKAARPHTLTASFVPVLVGHHACVVFLKTTPSITWQGLIFCLLVQLGTNLHNDYADFVKGADTKDRVGQARATQRGWLTPMQTAGASVACLEAALVVPFTLPMQLWGDRLGWFLVTSSIFNAFAYTGGPFPLGYIGLGNLSIGYSGLGDIFVMLYFGLVATLTIPYLEARMADMEATRMELLRQGPLWNCFIVALPVGFLATNILVVNNLRDRHTDVLAGKKTLAVRLGATFCRVQYTVLLVSSYSICLALQNMHGGGKEQPWLYLPFLSLPMALVQLKSVWKKEGSSLNKHVGGSALVQLLFCVLLVIGLRRSSI